MKSYNILESKYALKVGQNDEQLAKRINTAYYDIFEAYQNLTDEEVNDLRNFINNYFLKLRPTKYKEKEYKEKLEGFLYPEIYFVGLTHLYSNNGYIQYALLTDIYKEIKREFSKDTEKSRKIK